MAETLLQYSQLVVGDDGTEYEARAAGSPMTDGLWQAWIEFVPVGSGQPLRSPRETTQPNRADAVYWATGLSPIYLEGALRRAKATPLMVPITEPPPAIFDGPAPPPTNPVAVRPSSVLNPFSVYKKGERLLRQELSAMSAWHLVNIILDYELSDLPVEDLNRMPMVQLIELIVGAVRNNAEPVQKHR